MSKQRDQWGSSLGFVLAAAGSAVGLGNLWKFPYIAWDNNGGAFVLVYLVCIALIGLPIMMAEILIGRRTQSSPVPAFGALHEQTGTSKRWSVVGWIGVLAGVSILCFYAVIAGWSLSSFAQCLNWSINGYTPPEDGAFGAFIGNTGLQFMLALMFSGVTAFIVMRGISRGIEKATKILMPVLLLILVVLAINALTMKGIGQTLSFLFVPRLNELTTHGVLEALGHAFFTLSLGMGAMITYGSYMKKAESITKASVAIVVLDTAIALIACIIMYTILFSFPESQDQISASTAGMLFTTMPHMFYSKMAGGAILGPIFYILVAFAALSSTISLLEVSVALLVDRFSMTRVKATLAAAGSIFALTICVIFSLNSGFAVSRFKLFGTADSGLGYRLNEIFFKNKQGFMDFFDHLASNWLLPVGGLLITVYVGWFLNKKVSLDELGLQDENGNVHPFFKVFHFVLRYIAPLAILYIIYSVIFGAEDFT